MSHAHHSIRIVARRSGLSPHVIRIWEKRYGAVRPERTHTNRRVYSETEVERLHLLKQAVSAGHSIGQIANLSLDELRLLVAQTPGPTISSFEINGNHHSQAPAESPFLQECVAAVRSLDASTLEATLQKALIALGVQGLLHHVAGPLAQTVGDRWRMGEITAAHEHFASAALKVFLGTASRQFAVPDAAPGLIVTTPAGQIHELGAVMVGAAASNQGWRVTCLGASLPAAEIAGAVIQNKARALALSLVYPEDDPTLPQELVNLRRFVPADVKIIVGGRALRSYQEVLSQIGALQIHNLHELYAFLDQLRQLSYARAS